MASPESDVQFASHVRELRNRLNEALPRLVDGVEPKHLYEPARYVLAGKGKRFRPLLLLLSGEIFGTDVEAVQPAALAVEVFHNFTLVHDDIMDHAASRRGRETVHVRWDEGTAILCGDYLMALAYELLASLRTAQLSDVLHVFHRMVVKVCEGQTLDCDFESQPAVSVDDYLHMIDCKTGALLEASLEIGGLLGGASKSDRAHLAAVGRHVGRAFQIQDDLLDLIAPDARWGKAIGGDLMEGKKTFLLLSALEVARGEEQAWFSHVVAQRGLSASEVPEARKRMELLDVPQTAENAVRHHSSEAIKHLDLLPASFARSSLRWLIEQMQARLH